MSGWVPFPAEVWPEVAEALASPWPEGAAEFDLRWHHDQHGKLPGRPSLCKRWGWGDRKVRNLLASPERWWDAAKGPAPTSRDSVGSSEGPARVQRGSSGDTDERQEPAAIVQAGSSEGPAWVHTRVDPHSHSHSQKDNKSTDKSADLFERVVTYWERKVGPACGRRFRGPTRSSKVGKRLLSALQRQPDDVRDALRFVATSTSQRAVKLREYDGLTVETVLRHVEEYAELWRATEPPPPLLAVVPEAPPLPVVAPFLPPARRARAHEE